MLAAVSKMVEAGNTETFSKKHGNCIENDTTGERMRVDLNKGVYTIKAKILEKGELKDYEIVIDSGAADNVMPKSILQGVQLLAKQAGVRFAGANGNELGNYGRRKISFVPAEWGF